MLTGAVHGRGEQRELSGDRGNVQDYAVAMLLAAEAVNGQLGGPERVSDVEVECEE